MIVCSRHGDENKNKQKVRLCGTIPPCYWSLYLAGEIVTAVENILIQNGRIEIQIHARDLRAITAQSFYIDLNILSSRI